MAKTPEEAKRIVNAVSANFDIKSFPKSKKILNDLQGQFEGRKRTMSKSSSAREGDIMEIKTEAGFAYAQYTHFHPECGELMRVLQGFYPRQLNEEEISKIAKKKHRFSLFIDWEFCITSKITDYVGNFPISDFAREFPIFKKTDAMIDQCWNDPSSVIWTLWDGEREWKAGPLKDEERKKYPEVIECTSDVTFEYYIRTGKSLGEDLY
ncbi:MAG: hypothetical protein H7A42_03505 [Chlamydiales bacterium]|nr:hypothetical protein [Chlamydiales bacterium]